MIGTITNWVGLDRAGVGHALRLAVAAWLAFAIASVLHVKNAYWAAMPIWVVAQSSRGLLFERAVSRVLGTLAGALCGFAVLALAAPPPIQLLALSLTMALFAGLTHLVRGPYAYAALMAGITAAVVVVPSVIIQEPSRALALARVECTLIGVLTVTVVMGLFTPRANRTSFYQRARGLAGDAILFAAEEIAGRNADSVSTERRILQAFSLLDAESRPVSAGSFRGYRQLRHVDELVTASIAVMAAGQALGAVAQPDTLPAEQLAADLERLARDIQQGVTVRFGSSFHKRYPAIAPRRLARLERALEQLLKAETALASEAPDCQGAAVRRISLAPNRDRRLALRTALTTGLAALLSTTLAYASGLPSADLAALGVCIFSMLLGSMAMPQTVAPQLFIGVVAGVIGATLYRLVVQPHVDTDLAWLLVTLFPFLLIGGLVRASRRFAVPAVDANMCFMLASQAGMPAAATAQILGGSAALVLGAAAVALGYRAFPRTAERALRVAMLRMIRELHAMLAGRRPIERADWQALSTRLVLRVMFHASHDPYMRQNPPEGMLAMLNLGNSLADLRTMAGQHSRAELATQALVALNSFARAPAETVIELERLANQATDRWQAVTLALAAQSLSAASGMILHADAQR